jgi:outer membrane receptor protein involved in Fe transport
MTTRNNVAEMRRSMSVSATRYLVSIAVAAAIGGAALPQHAFAADTDVTADTPATPVADQEAVAEVVVTGSRIARRDLSAPSPVVTVSKDSFENTSKTGIEAVLNEMPQFVPVNTQFTSTIQGSATANPGSSTLNLRGIGANRNLVLFDGRRAQPSDASLAIDVNTIPASAIESVEVITGGASAVYGPDAMAGVVNFVLKKNFQGLEVDMKRGETFDGDGAETNLSALMGMNGADGKGNIMVGLDYTKREAAYQINRDFYVNGWNDPANPSNGFLDMPGYAATANQPTQAGINAILPNAPLNAKGASLATPGSVFYFNNNGTPFIQQGGGYGYNGPINSLNAGRDTEVKVLSTTNQLDQAFTGGYVSTPLDRHSIFLRGNYNFNDNLQAYVQANYSNIEVLQRGGLPPAITTWQVQIPRDGRTLPAALNTLLDSRVVDPNAPAGTTGPSAPWNLSQVLDYNGAINIDSVTNVWQTIAGLKGNLPFRDWTFDVYGSKGNTSVSEDYSGLPSYQRYAFLVAQPNFGAGTNIKAASPTPPKGPNTTQTLSGYSINCPTGLPVFQVFTPAQSCLDGIADNMSNKVRLEQDIIEGSIQGGLIQLPAGQARFALGATYRKDDFAYAPGNPQNQILDSPVGLFASASTAGSTNVKEEYTEFLVPIFKRLDLELGYRNSDFNTAGTKGTWKALFNFRALDSVTFRGGFQYAARAPNAAELFTGPTQQVVSFPSVDPCSVATVSPWGNIPPGDTFTKTPANPNYLKVQALCRAIIGNSTSGFDTQTYNSPAGPNGFTRQSPPFFPLEIEVDTGNPKVGPEFGRTYTFGAVITEPFGISRLTATVDAYRIAISDAISPQSSTTVYNNCFNYNGTSNPTYDPNNQYCKLIARDPVTGDRSTVVALYSNLGTLLTQGVDFQVNWSHDLGPGHLSLGTNINYLNKFVYQTGPTSALVDAKGTLDQGGQFSYRVLSNVGYAWQGLSVGLNWEHLPSIDNAAASLNPLTTIKGATAYDLFDLSSSYNWNNFTFSFGIDNLANKQPLVVGANPGVTTASNQTNPGFYDPLGRRYYVGVKAKF